MENQLDSSKVQNSAFSENFSSKGDTRMHTEEKPHPCKICASIFSEMHDLETHMLTHAQEKLFSCKVCNASFCDELDLEKHICMHTETKPDSSKVCNSAFSTNSSAKTDTKMPTDEKSYSCKICESPFSEMQELEKHMLVHVVEKPFCKMCGYPFSTYLDRKSHMQMHAKKNKLKTFDKTRLQSNRVDLPITRLKKEVSEMIQITERTNEDRDRTATFYNDKKSDELPEISLCTKSGRAINMPSRFKNFVKNDDIIF